MLLRARMPLEKYEHPREKELMITLDNAWNSQDWDTFKERHANNVAVFWPGQADPTRGVHNHHQEAIEFFKMFPDNHLVNFFVGTDVR
jgi:hypothetical protein